MNEEENKFNENCKWVEEQRWKPGKVWQHESCDKIWYKYFPDVKPRCYGNNDKDLQLTLKAYNFISFGEGISFSVEICAESYDGIWINFSAYQIKNNDLKLILDKQVQKLIRAWIACQKI